MYKLLTITTISILIGCVLAGCANLNNTQQRMVSGAAIGGTLGGPIGAGIGAGIGYIVEKTSKND